MKSCPTPLQVGLIIFVFSSTLSYGQPFPQAHSHNDYEHAHPLFDALHFGFTSVEADVYLIKNELLVSHTRPILNARSLAKLYLAPLDSILRVNHGKIYPDYDGVFYLMIDVKADGPGSYKALKDLLQKYPALNAMTGSHKSVVVFLSGDRPIEMIANAPDHGLSLDGRPADLGKGYSASVMPIISDTYRKWSDWNGEGHPSFADLQRIKELAQRVHGEQKRLRLWAIPDNPTAWRELLKSGVDIINTDHLSELFLFLKSGKK